MERRIYRTLKDIISNIYGADNNYSKFYIKIYSDERKTFNGRYTPKKKEIAIYNLSRPYNHIIVTVLHEVSHHIQTVDAGKSDHFKEFYDILHKLLLSALEMGIINKTDISSIKDSLDKERLIRYYGNIQYWEFKKKSYNEDIILVKIANSYNIREELKLRGYSYSKHEQVWMKEIDRNMKSEENKILLDLTSSDNIKFKKGNELIIEAIYYIAVLNSYEYREKLKKNGYIYNGYGINKKSWNKKIKANKLAEEKEFLNQFKNAEVKILNGDKIKKYKKK